MIKQVVKDVIFLGQKSDEATKADLSVADDLRDTLAANREHCVGMAANMIGVRKCIIIANMGMGDIVMFNPVITKKDSPYETEESCLSLKDTPVADTLLGGWEIASPACSGNQLLYPLSGHT